jgi:tripartite-type tricarboxylate transporter receptor subunit TctC
MPLRGSWLSGCESRWDSPLLSKTSPVRTGRSAPPGAARARPDGYTLCLGTNGTHVLNGAFYSLPYDVLNDFVPVSPLVIYPDVLYARRTITARNLNELVGWLKANKASAGIIAGDFRLITIFFQRQISATLTPVPYRGGAPAVQDLAAGQIDILIATPLYLPPVRAASIKAFAVTSDARFAEAPELSTFTEIGLPAIISGPRFSHRGARRKTSSASSTGPPLRHWPIRLSAPD